MDEAAREFHGVERVVAQKRREVHADEDLGGGIPLARLVESGVGGAAARDGEVVAFAAGDLGNKDGVQLFGESLVAAHIHADFLAVAHPVQIPPDLATDESGGAFRGRQAAEGFEERGKDAEVRGVLVGGVVGVDDVGPGGAEDLKKVVAQGGVGRIRGEGTGVVELDHGAIAADPGRFDLLVGPPLGQFPGVEARQCPVAETALAVGAGDPAEPLVGFSETFNDSVERHELEIVVVRPDAQMGDAREAIGPRGVVGHEEPAGKGVFLQSGVHRHGI